MIRCLCAPKFLHVLKKPAVLFCPQNIAPVNARLPVQQSVEILIIDFLPVKELQLDETLAIKEYCRVVTRQDSA